MKTNSTYHNAAINFLINPDNRGYRYLLLIVCMAVVAVNSALLSFPYNYAIAFAYSIGLLIIYLSIIYLNIKILVPRYLLQNRYRIYIGMLTTLALFTIAFDLTIEFYIKKFFHLNYGKFSILERKDDFVLNIIATCFLYVICFAGTSIGVLFKHWLASVQQINQLEKDTIKAELQHLKSRIYPGFLFKTLEKAGEQAIEYSIVIDENIKHVLVPPLLFVSIVLPTVDSITEYEKMPIINLSFGIKDKSLMFVCSGTKSGKVTDIEDIVNSKRRLDLLFGENYTLDFSEDEKSQSINLGLNIL